MPLSINPTLELPDEDLEWRFIRSAGPGGQNVNKVASGVQLRFALAGNRTLPAAVKQRLRRLAGARLNDDDSILIRSNLHRSQEQNRRDAGDRLRRLVRAALVEPKPRKATAPSRAERQRRIDAKKQRAVRKRERSARAWD